MPRVIGLGLRALEFIFTVILLGLVGSLEAQSDSNPESVHFSMFTAAWSALFLLYLIPATWTESFTFHPIIPIVLDTLNVVFTFCAAVTLAARTKAKSCSNHIFLDTNSIAMGSENRCREAQAACAFFWFLWACYVGSLISSVLGGRSSANLRATPSVRRPMSQV
ncbi:non-classical export protein Nce102, putative [Talaromyces stipitatus ATCC 10500]|uniref:Non-classical export protein Nce102, putative n=1 Tax=Talaromyces stipitatus (strain ATCC 10500 / CBS 375.48 / QM 6759 / NRRL 1006) TaxID=441959 RepID=B8MKH6_TALSN|nr:non-classical export protein Nce102, putative [Talaromyces stipitatus ATCC 10500]EED15331.1 non-classical export protein Nce102, putative [Talaromyces stipitatus ATCC 10500]